MIIAPESPDDKRPMGNRETCPLAIYHCSVRTFSRSKGHSAVAAAAYRSGSVLRDERSGAVHRFERRKGIVASFILVPQSAPDVYNQRAVLWNAAERAENRTNSRVAREVILALPHELSSTERQSLTRDMALWLVERYGVAVDVALHSPVPGDGHDERNHHAHLLFTTREVNEDGLGAKTRVLDDKEQGPQEIELIRDVWEALANAALGQAGHGETRIDKRTLEDQGIDRIPQIHIGPEAKAVGDAEDREDKKTDEDDEGDGDQGGSSDTGGLAPPSGKDAKEDKTKEAKERPLDQNRRRADFVEEIKKINAQRAALSDIPLETQIEAIESLMDRLDRRVKLFATLLSKTSLPHALIKSIKSIIQFSRDLLINRIQSREVYQTLKEERRERSERQSLRYGRTYRFGIHERMQEIKSQLQRLEETTQSYKQYKGFVDKIDQEIAKRPALALSAAAETSLPAAPLAAEEKSLNLHMKAELLRQNIPPEYRANLEIKQQAEARPPALKQAFTQKAEPSSANKPPLKLQATPPANIPDTRADRKSWFIPSSEKTCALQEMIDKRLAEIRVVSASQKPQTLSVQKDFNPHSQNAPAIRQAANEAVREKIRVEAADLRKAVPPQYRAEPYSEMEQARPDISESPVPDQTDQNLQAEKPRAKMSGAFNSAAASDTDKPKPSQNPDPDYRP